jgi:hypothetical protein
MTAPHAPSRLVGALAAACALLAPVLATPAGLAAPLQFDYGGAPPDPAPAPVLAPSLESFAAATAPGADTITLARLLGSDAPLRLSGVEAQLRVPLPVPASARLDPLTFVLEGTVSQALTPDSQLVVELDGRVLHQVRLYGARTRLHEQVAIPAAWLRPGFQSLRVRVVQHYTDRCEYPMAPQLWTVIDPAASGFVARVTPQPGEPRLDRLDALFDKAGWRAHPVVPVLLAGRVAPSPETLSALGLVAQGVGQRYDYVPVALTQGRLPEDPGAIAAALPADAPGAVVLGRFESLAPLLAGLGVPTDRGPVAVLRPVPGAPARFLLILAAGSDAELATPASAFAMQRYPWPDRPWVALREPSLPPLGSVTGAAAALRPSANAYPISALGFRSTTYSGTAPGGAQLRFWNDAWQGRVQVRVHASYAAGMAPQSALNVLANDTLTGSIPLSNVAGGSYDNYAVTVPAGALHPGWNTLALQPVLVPQDSGGDCKPFFAGNLAVTLHDDTTLQAFGGSAREQPDLALLAIEGRALRQAPVGAGMALQLAAADPATVGAGLTLMAKLTQVFKGPLLRAEFVVGPSHAGARNRLWVGALGQLPEAVRGASGLDAQGELQVPVPLIRSTRVEVLEGAAVQSVRDALGDSGAAPDTLSARAAVPIAPAGHMGAATRLVDGMPVTVFTAASPAELAQGMRSVVDYGPWSQLQGSTALWRIDGSGMRTISADDAPFVAYSLRGGLGLWMSQYPWWSLAGVIALLVAAAWLARRGLAAYRLRYLPGYPAQRRDDGVQR